MEKVKKKNRTHDPRCESGDGNNYSPPNKECLFSGKQYSTVLMGRELETRQLSERRQRYKKKEGDREIKFRGKEIKFSHAHVKLRVFAYLGVRHYNYDYSFIPFGIQRCRRGFLSHQKASALYSVTE